MTTAEQPLTIRQSTLATFVRCPLSARYDLELQALGDYHTPEQQRGVMFHRVAARILRELSRTGESKMPLGAAYELMEDELAQRDMPSEAVIVLGPEQHRELRIAVWGFAQLRWNTKRIMALERRLYATLKGPDGVERVLTGQPDMLLAEPPAGAVICDWKTGWGPPKQPRTDEVRDEKVYLSERGMYQLDVYGLLAMNTYPSIQKVSLREIHVMVGEERTATLRRDELPEVRDRLANDLMLIDRAIHEGPESGIWQPVGGRWCHWCTGKLQCPRPVHDRREGSILDLPMAQEYAMDLAKIEAQREAILDAAKAYTDVHGPIPLEDGSLLGWDAPPPEDAAKAPDAERGTCKWCGEPIWKTPGPEQPSLDKRRQFHGGAARGEPECKAAWDAAGGTRRFRLHVPDERYDGSREADEPPF